ncbi:hypothetical protein HMPREF1979_00480 [Actinomyces johnsonii F0542]|uniref:Uncharacterized protein n=1 Tax=Actinomyces johnsonii F0542 TaxID=1321818 RepID=U1S0P1_9ACTO|nr:hypothetical protein HMPREF1979_00480 [Actinomyces johnsonii F0542]
MRRFSDRGVFLPASRWNRFHAGSEILEGVQDPTSIFHRLTELGWAPLLPVLWVGLYPGVGNMIP